uniref:Uncharacterized protein n=1 Tax=Romanomermis culicivorax TaxID=13658 RepID=A0A915JMJ8_ROMCU
MKNLSYIVNYRGDLKSTYHHHKTTVGRAKYRKINKSIFHESSSYSGRGVRGNLYRTWPKLSVDDKSSEASRENKSNGLGGGAMIGSCSWLCSQPAGGEAGGLIKNCFSNLGNRRWKGSPPFPSASDDKGSIG